MHGKGRSACAAFLSALLAMLMLAMAPSATAAWAGPGLEPAEPVTSDQGATVAPAEPLLDEPQRGLKAIRRLGDELAVAAKRNDLGADELRTLLRTDAAVWVDTEGLVYYVDPVGDASPTSQPVPAATAPLTETFALHSNPGANLTILLDFDGGHVSGTAWNAQNGVTPGDHPAWDPARDGAAFNDNERAMIQQIWAIVAGDYAPFAVDVTTQDPGDAAMVRDSSTDAVYGTRVLVTPSDDPHAKICNRGCGGVAYLSVFDRLGTYTQPAWVFPQALGDDPKSVAEAITHEAGHNLGLDHDGTSTQGYYRGHGVWAPIMGVGYDRPVVQWSRGSYSDANNQQDDVAIVGGYLGMRPDEASGSEATPSVLPSGPALIGTRADADAYLLGSCAAGAVVEVAPAAVAANLDVRAVLYDAAGVQRAVASPASGAGDGISASGLGGTLTVPENGDGWVVTVDGAGEGAWSFGGYDDYGSLGAYTVNAPGCDGELAVGVPSAPEGVSSSATGTDALTLSWAEPAAPGDGPVTGYVVSRSGSTTRQTLDPAARSHTFTGLAPGTTYQLSVRAVNATGAGHSVTVSATTDQLAPAPPSAPRSVTGSYDPLTGKLHAWWTEPASTGTQPISGYAIYLDGAYLGQVAANSRGVDITSTAAGGYPAGQYVVGVAAVSSVGFSPVATVTITVDPPDRPANDNAANPTQLSGANGSVSGDNTYATKESTDPYPPTPWAAGGYSVWYSWTPAFDGPATMGTSGGGTDRDTTLGVYTGQPGALTRVAGSDDTSTVNWHASVALDAKAGTRYLVVVDGFSHAGGSGPFTLTWSQQPVTAPSAPTGVAALAGDRSASLSWVAPAANGSPITGYTVTSSPGGWTCGTSGALSCTVEGLTNGTAYTFTVRATNEVGDGPASGSSNSVTPAGVPSQPAAPVAVRGDRSAAVSWTAVSANGSPINGYTVTAAPGGRTCATSGALSCTVQGLTNGTAYTFTVHAKNGVGSSPVSGASNGVTPAGVPGQPAAPVAQRGDRSAVLTWASVSANGSPVTGYTVTASPGGQTCTTTGALSCTVAGLTNGTAYTFVVRATNDVGNGPESEPSQVVTPEVGAEPVTAPSKMPRPKVVVRGTKAIVTWKAADDNGSPVLRYLVDVSVGRDKSVDGSKLRTVFKGLKPGPNKIRIAARNTVGTSPYSRWVEIRVG